MAITRKEVEQVASLARLSLEPAELDALTRDLDSILDHVRELQATDVDGVRPMGGVSEHPAPMRQDVAGADPLAVPVEELAPDWEQDFFVVPRLAALDADAAAP